MKNLVQENILAAQKGDQIAFTFLLNHYWSEVYNFMLKRTANEVDAEDITIETFSKAFTNISKYDPTYAFNTWLISIAKNVHIDMIRKRKNMSFLDINDEENQQYHDIIDDTMNKEDELIQEQNLVIFKSYINLLKPHYQEVIDMRFFQEMSYNEIAEALNEPLNNVKVKIMRAKKLLAEIILKQIDQNFSI
ncbi:sigma-70 family RNA polymerase sigma factor [Myroides odoratimimus]|uniref:Sigma-70 family RNA polymerase sigma factor n=1 Tax=Myroides odoratimimus CIP 101113 TaxID=883154 RepID=A0AAV3EZQ8_9FLAO|nr:MULTISPECIES: sigma-70 family RNA polymerase sigma factor [Myroides]AJA67680.1 RNA polymerase sigma factor, sigma-70 family [Myroides sp. A21]EHO06362.1 sigma-70 family RNA polymerase sigma factor [Myroides odoratimimus CIP 101113]EHO06521.1 sigma-70 family RNA polymerase sigma factor [Myroides odoratimimus CCUG 12901]MCA4792937.1 sigma-70 family RNA polymerase sigma factor [Myroides odoratimimus]MCA4807634.1 sigma-70 family RNA polymerase sigma factor [Myroides odoratimimus]